MANDTPPCSCDCNISGIPSHCPFRPKGIGRPSNIQFSRFILQDFPEQMNDIIQYDAYVVFVIQGYVDMVPNQKTKFRGKRK
jgi:hypothetical protein